MSAAIWPAVCGSFGAGCLSAHHTTRPSATAEMAMPTPPPTPRRRPRPAPAPGGGSGGLAALLVGIAEGGVVDIWGAEGIVATRRHPTGARGARGLGFRSE